jgi:mannosyl-oligosaccharide alpha-1,2-mannosidase
VQGVPLKPAPNTLLAELGSLSLEFTRLTQLTGDPKYFDAIQRVTDNLDAAQLKTAIPGLWPTFIDLEKLVFDNKHFTLGGMADSTYEYLPKEHLLLGGRTQQYQRMYEATVEPMKKHLLYRPMTKNGEDILFSGNAHAHDKSSSTSLEPQTQHLTCYVGGMVGIAAKIFHRLEDLSTARKLVDGCIWAYDSMPTGMMPELFHTTVCEDMNDCPWDEKKWLAGVRAAGKHRSQISAADNKEEESARTIVEQDGLQPGFTVITDAQYHLRLVQSMRLPFNGCANAENSDRKLLNQYLSCIESLVTRSSRTLPGACSQALKI